MNREVLQEGEGGGGEEGGGEEEGEGGEEVGEVEDAVVGAEDLDVDLLQALSPGRQLPPALMLLPLFPPSPSLLAHICNSLAIPSQ